MTGSVAGQTGLLLATMEPPVSMEDEFQQWYDTEHFPERAGIEGFLTATRAICIDGWPRYAAFYDLTDIDVMRSPGYAKIAGRNYSRWTDRIISHVWGQYRAEGTQIYPGKALFGDKGSASRIVLWRFSAIPEGAIADVVTGLRKLYEDLPETAQVRVFESPQPNSLDCIGIVELHAPRPPEITRDTGFGEALRHLDMVNTYVRYQRVWGTTYPHKI